MPSTVPARPLTRNAVTFAFCQTARSSRGEPYRDASGNEYLPMFVQPVLVYEADAAGLRRAYERAMERDVVPAVYTKELFETGHDQANRAAVAAVAADDLDLVGLTFRAGRKVADKVVGRLRFHP